MTTTQSRTRARPISLLVSVGGSATLLRQYTDAAIPTGEEGKLVARKLQSLRNESSLIEVEPELPEGEFPPIPLGKIVHKRIRTRIVPPIPLTDFSEDE